MDRAHLVMAAHKTVDTFAAITRRPLRLRNGKKPCTDGVLIDAPFKHPSFYCLVEHELAHVLFLSDFAAKQALVAEAQAFALARGDERGAEAFGAVTGKIYNLLEDERVNSLWGELYPGSLAELRALALRTMRRHRHRAQEDLVTWALCVGSRVPRLPEGPYSVLGPALVRSLGQVQKGAQESSLIATRELLPKLWGCRGSSPVMETSASDRLEDLRPNTRPPAGQAGETERAREAARMVQAGDEGARESALFASRIRASTWLSEVRERLRQVAKQDGGGPLLKCVRDRTTVKDVAADTLPPPPALGPEDAQAVARLAQLFRRVRGRKAHRPGEQGLEVDLPAAIERALTGRALPCYREEVAGRGFRALLLVDRSSSMEGAPTEQVERAARVLRRALTQAGVPFETWGFRAKAMTALIERVPAGMDLHASEALPVEGQTPLHVAVAVAVNHLRAAREKGHLLVLTDGEPTFMGAIKTKTSPLSLKEQVREEIRRARKLGVGVSALVVGEELEDADAFNMFGPRWHWSRSNPHALQHGIVRWVTDAVVRHHL